MPPQGEHFLKGAATTVAPESLKWTDQLSAVSGAVTAAFTIVLAIGVIIAARQFYLSRRFSKLQETQHLIDNLNSSALPIMHKRIDRFTDSDAIGTYLVTSRKRANGVYSRLWRLRRLELTRFHGRVVKLRSSSRIALV